MDWLDGKKTILGSVAAGLVIILRALDVLDDDTAGVLLGVILTFTGVSLRLAMNKNG